MFRSNRFGWMLSLLLALWVVAAQAHEFRYRYVSLDHAELPAGFVLFDVERMDNRGRIYGEAYDCASIACDEILPHVAVYTDGVVTVLQAKQPSLVGAVNDMIGLDFFGGGTFLLKRVGSADHESSAATDQATRSGLAMGERQGIPAAAAAKVKAIQRLRLRPLKADSAGPKDRLESLPGLR
jgi:hypothetical protein